MFSAIRAICHNQRSLSLISGQMVRSFGISSVHFNSLQKQFEEAKERLNTLSEDPGNAVKLQLYGLFKQATEGSVKSKRPGMTDFVGRAKWDAWNANKDISQEDAQKKYIELIDSLTKTEEITEASRSTSGQNYKYIIVEDQENLKKITLNRPKKFNALTSEMYHEWMDALNEAENDPKIVLTAVTGAGSYYCAGNDLNSFTSVPPEKVAEAAENTGEFLKKFIGTFIDFKKPLVAVVNGPAVGVAVTTLGLFDGVFASDKATFLTPFSNVGQTNEGCSSVIFPNLMGFGKASQMLMFNKKLTAQEAYNAGIVTEVFPDDRLEAEIWPRLKEFSKLPPNCLYYSKALMRSHQRELLHKVNIDECERLKERWQSEDLANAVMKFFKRKS